LQQHGAQLKACQQETTSHECGIGYKRMAQETRARAPDAQQNEYSRQGQYLTNLNSNIEADDIGDKAIGRQIELLQFGRQPEAMKQTEYEYRNTGVRFKAKQPFEPVHIFEGLVHDGQANYRVDEIGVYLDIRQDSSEQGDAVADGEQSDVLHDVFGSVEKEYNTEQEQQMIVTGHHVLRAEIHEGEYGWAINRFDKIGVAARNSVGQSLHGEQQRGSREKKRDAGIKPGERWPP